MLEIIYGFYPRKSVDLLVVRLVVVIFSKIVLYLTTKNWNDFVPFISNIMETTNMPKLSSKAQDEAICGPLLDESEENILTFFSINSVQSRTRIAYPPLPIFLKIGMRT